MSRERKYDRRTFLKFAGTALGVAALAACSYPELEDGPRNYGIPLMSEKDFINAPVLNVQRLREELLSPIEPPWALNRARFTRWPDEMRGKMVILTDITDIEAMLGKWRAAVTSGTSRLITEHVQVGQASEVIGKKIQPNFAKLVAINVEFSMPTNYQGNLGHFNQEVWEIFLERNTASGNNIIVDRRQRVIVTPQ